MAISNLLQDLQHLFPQKIDLTLGRIKRVLKALGSPHQRLPPTIHIAGTNGKGSTLSYLRAIYEAAGLRVHGYTSPHLIHYNERIRLKGKLITDEALLYYLQQVQKVNHQQSLTFFEAFTAAAFLAFSETPADVLLLEVGLGGRLDATNAIEASIACVFTPISFDHQEFLGHTLDLIAHEKAGIIKEKVPVFIGKQKKEVQEVLVATANKNLSTLFSYGVQWQRIITFGKNKCSLQIKFGDKIYTFPQPSLKGEHQLDNAALAAAVALGLKKQIPILEQEISDGLSHTLWWGRLQRLSLLHDCPEVWIDGAHNLHGFQVLANFINSQQLQSPMKTTLVMAMLNNRDPKIFFNIFDKLVDSYVLIDMQDKTKFHEPKNIKTFTNQPTDILLIDDLLKFLGKKDLFGSRIFITGSLYLIGKVLEMSHTVIK